MAALVICHLSLVTSCSDDNQEARQPVATVSVDKTDLVINESMEITFSGVADQVVVYTGDEGHDYALREQSNTGLVMNKGQLTYSYAVPGTFHVVVVASTYDTYLAGGLQTATTEFDVTVTDNIVDIDRLYSNITPNVYYAELIGDADWVLRIPTKQVYNRREIALNAKRQRLSFDIASDSTKIFVDDVIYDTRAYYDLTQTHQIHVSAYSGATRDYTLHTLVYPEFSSITLDGKTATLTRDAFYQDLLVYSAAVTNPAEAAIVYTCTDDVRLYADGVELPSGSTVDLTDTERVYTLRRILPDRPDIYADTRVRFVNE
ncbi:MAG: hypothetical protein IJM81_06050 [Prevotella sp.]|nr:hypothetical protein [Prevotella sp.]